MIVGEVVVNPCESVDFIALPNEKTRSGRLDKGPPDRPDTLVATEEKSLIVDEVAADKPAPLLSLIRNMEGRDWRIGLPRQEAPQCWYALLPASPG